MLHFRCNGVPNFAVASAGDKFSQSLFDKAGRHLGSMVRTLAPHTRHAGSSDTRIHDVSIVAVGSVWKSWKLLEKAFVTAATAPHPSEGTQVASFRLLRLTETSAVGAAWKAAELAGTTLPLDFSSLTTVLFAYKA